MWITEPCFPATPMYCHSMAAEGIHHIESGSESAGDRLVHERQLELGLANLMLWGVFRRRLQVGAEWSARNDVLALLDWLWANRGRSVDTMTVPAQSYYDDYFLVHRRLLADLLASEQADVGTRTAPATDAKRGRQTVAEQLALANRIDSLKSELVKLCERYDIRDYRSTTEMSRRYAQERLSLQQILYALKHLSAVDLAVMFAERLDRVFKTSLTRDNSTGQLARQPNNERERQILGAAQAAIEDWALQDSEVPGAA